MVATEPTTVGMPELRIERLLGGAGGSAGMRLAAIALILLMLGMAGGYKHGDVGRVTPRRTLDAGFAVPLS
jgi:hypothetical protein